MCRGWQPNQGIAQISVPDRVRGGFYVGLTDDQRQAPPFSEERQFKYEGLDLLRTGLPLVRNCEDVRGPLRVCLQHWTERLNVPLAKCCLIGPQRKSLKDATSGFFGIPVIGKHAHDEGVLPLGLHAFHEQLMNVVDALERQFLPHLSDNAIFTKRRTSFKARPRLQNDENVREGRIRNGCPNLFTKTLYTLLLYC